jgi:ubiquinone/menaquinone biosynthesis C-methylase UbiE
MGLKMSDSQSWQLTMFRRSLKKQLKLEALLETMGDITGMSCLLVTCGDNNGALNWHFRQHGGQWTWGDVAGENLASMQLLLGEPVFSLDETQLSFGDDQFDCVVAIDVLEHLQEDQPFLKEIARVLKPGGKAIVTVPNGDPHLLANRIKWRIGMTPDVYGHTRAGYTISELAASISKADMTPIANNGYSRFFTEMVELATNFGYVFILSRNKGKPSQGQIAPSSEGELKTHGLAYQVYTIVFPLLKLISALDNFLPESSNNAVIVAATKPERV